MALYSRLRGIKKLHVDSKRKKVKNSFAYTQSTVISGFMKEFFVGDVSLGRKPGRQFEEFGVVVFVVGGIAAVCGLFKVKVCELVVFSAIVLKGMVLNLNDSSVGIVIFGSEESIFGDGEERSSNDLVSKYVGLQMLGGFYFDTMFFKSIINGR